jgi:small-conductance mechanosensitive channel
MKKFNFKKKQYYLLVILLFLNLIVWSQDNSFDFNKVTSEIQEISNKVDRYETLLKQDKINEDSLNTYLINLYVYRDSVLNKLVLIQKTIQNSNELLSKLAPEQKIGVEEPENIVVQKKELNEEIGKLTIISQSSQLLITKIDDLSGRISKLKTTRFFSNLTKRVSTPFSKKLWIEAFENFKTGLDAFVSQSKDFGKLFWINSDRFLNITVLLISWILAFLVYKLPNSIIWKKIKLYIASREDSDNNLDKKMRIFLKPSVHFLLALLAGAFVYWGFMETGLITSKATPLIYRIWIGISVLFFIWNFAHIVFQPDKSYWNGLSVTEGNTVKVRTIFILFFILFVIDRIVSSIFSISNVGVNLLMVQAIVSSTIFATLLLLFFNKNLWKINNETNSDQLSKDATVKIVNGDLSVNKSLLLLEIIRYLGSGLAVILIGILLLGYLRLADFMFHRIMLFFIFIFLFYSTRVLTFWILEKLTETRLNEQHNEISYKDSATGTHVTEDYNADKKILINFWMKMGIDFAIALFAIPVFLFLIGFDWLEVDHSLSIFVSGFTIGAITISLKNIFSGIFIFLIIIILTRILTSFLTKKFKEIDHVSIGVNNTIITLINYFGILMAFLTALPVIGVSFSKLSIIVGALSVGIGFGLKNIVNDFVSGLILLFERPIKIGDRIQVQSGEGYVEKINARATIIRTFDMATIVVPNSELVSLSLLNWFYKGKQGRLKLAVGVDYGADPKIVKELILQCATEHPSVLKKPEPNVVWMSFGDSSLNFELRAFLANYDESRVVKSDLHFKIFEKFKEAGISIPFPQRDIHIKSTNEIVQKQFKDSVNKEDLKP